METDADTSAPHNDVVLVHSPTEDGQGYRVIRQRGGEIEVGAVRPLEEGKPIHGEIVRLKAREDSPVLFDVDVQHGITAPRAGPAQVATEKYRQGWDSIFARNPSPSELN